MATSSAELPPGVLVRTFGDETLLLHPGSWETHLLNSSALGLVMERAGGAGVVDGVNQAPSSEEERAALEELDNFAKSLGLSRD